MARRNDGVPAGQLAQPGTVRAAGSAASEAEQGLSIGQIIQMLLKHKIFILVCTLVCALAALIYVKLATPIYEASASIRIDQGRAGSLGLSDLAGGVVPAGSEIINTEIQVLQSDQVAIATLNSLPPELFKQYTGEDKTSLAIPPGKEVLTSDQEDLIGGFKQVLGVKQAGETQIVDLTFRDPNPKIAAAVLNHLVAAYLKQNFDSRYQSVEQVTEWLSAQIQQLKARAAAAQQKLANFQERNNIIGTVDSNVTTDRLRLLNERLATAESDRIVKEAQLRAASGSAHDPAVLASLVPDPKLQALQASQATLYAQYAQLSTKFGPNYTPLAQLKKQMQAVDAEVRVEAQTIRNRLQEDYDAAKRTEDMLRGEYQNQEQKAYAFNREQADFAVLQSEGSTSRQLYNTLELKLEQAPIDAGLNGVNTMTMDSARSPLYPVEPKKAIIVVFGTILGLLIGIASAFIVEASADKVTTLEQAAGSSTYRPLVGIPHVGGRRARTTESTTEPAVVVARQPLSPTAEPYRKLRNVLLQSPGGGSLKTFMITSADTGEGKSTVAVNFAIVLAQTGANVLLVDTELRRPTLHSLLSTAATPGLAEGLDAASGVSLVQPLTEVPTLSFLPAGTSTSMAAEVLASEKFRLLLQSLEGRFDFIVLKAAPLLPVSDSVPLANWVDGVLLVVRYGVTRLKQLQRTREVLDQTQADVLGIIVDDVPAGATRTADKAYGEATYAA